MNLNEFTAILLRSIANSDIAPLNIERYWRDNHSFCVTTDDNHVFLVKIGEVRFKELIPYEKISDLNIAKQFDMESKNDFLKIMDTMLQNNPLLMNVLFSAWKLRELNLITDADLDRIIEGVEENQDDIFIDFLQHQNKSKQ